MEKHLAIPIPSTGSLETPNWWRGLERHDLNYYYNNRRSWKSR